jgi:hypothetical protein
MEFLLWKVHLNLLLGFRIDLHTRAKVFFDSVDDRYVGACEKSASSRTILFRI